MNRTLVVNVPPYETNRNTKQANFLTPCPIFSGARTRTRVNARPLAVSENGSKRAGALYKPRPYGLETPNHYERSFCNEEQSNSR